MTRNLVFILKYKLWILSVVFICYSTVVIDAGTSSLAMTGTITTTTESADGSTTDVSHNAISTAGVYNTSSEIGMTGNTTTEADTGSTEPINPISVSVNNSKEGEVTRLPTEESMLQTGTPTTSKVDSVTTQTMVEISTQGIVPDSSVQSGSTSSTSQVDFSTDGINKNTSVTSTVVTKSETNSSATILPIISTEYSSTVTISNNNITSDINGTNSPSTGMTPSTVSATVTSTDMTVSIKSMSLSAETYLVIQVVVPISILAILCFVMAVFVFVTLRKQKGGDLDLLQTNSKKKRKHKDFKRDSYIRKSFMFYPNFAYDAPFDETSTQLNLSNFGSKDREFQRNHERVMEISRQLTFFTGDL